MARLQRRRFDESQDVRVTPGGRVEVVELDDRVVARITWQPGWRWSVDVKPIAGTQYCQSHHVGFLLQGQLRIQMADGIEIEFHAGDVLEIPPGHDAWVVGDEPVVTVDFEALRGFAKGSGSANRRTLASVMMTDIVDSTAHAVEMGQERWLELISRHNELAERAIDSNEGRLIKTTGDGVLGLFDSAERAVRAAMAIAQAVRPLGIEIRAAVQTGEIEMSAGDVRGVVVHATARMMALAGADEVLVSATVRDLLDGTELAFEDFGLHALKGLPGERHLYRVSPA
ncbi:MAG TPA: adenylate/guanylate cyclase domain-containing protein [Candidatus Limnocylindrales bacterium]